MSAEGMPQADSSFLGRLLESVTALVIRFPVTTMVASGLLAAAAMVYAQLELKFNTSRSDLLSPKSDYNRRWLEYAKEFGEQEDVILVVSGENRQAIAPVLDEVAAQLAKQPKHFRSIFHRVDPSRLQSKGLYYLDQKQLHEIESFLHQAQPILQGDWAALNLGGRLEWFAHQLASGGQMQAALESAQGEQAQSLQVLASALAQPGPYQSPWPEIANFASMKQEDDGYILANGGRVGMVLLWLTKDETDSFAEYSSAITELRRIIGQTKSRHPEAWIGLTGMPVMENDEMESSQTAMTQAGVLSFVGVALLYLAGFGCVRHPLMAVVALLVPMAWSFGFIVMAVGHLNILSAAFGTIVIGLGSDFGVYHIAQYLRLRGERFSTRDALLETARGTGRGITTGALSTALAFFTIGLSDFPGIAELGIIAGGGIVLCWIAALTTLPAMIQWSDAKRPPWKVPAPLDIYAWMKPVTAFPRFLVVTYTIATVVISLGIGRLWYDHNLLNMQAAGLESVELEKQLLQQNDFSSSFAVSVARTREELLARKEQFLSLPMVDSVKEIVSYFPGDAAQKRPIVERIHASLANLPQSVPPIPVVSPGALERSLGRLQQVMSMAGKTAEARTLQQMNQMVRALPEQEFYRRLSGFQQAMAVDMLKRLSALRTVANVNPPELNDLPEGLVSRFVGQHGAYAMQIYTKADIWNMDAMEQFVQQVRSVDREVTGNPLQVYEASRQMKWSYEKGALYGVITVLLVVYLDFRNVRMALLALLPLVMSKLQLFGLMGFLDIPLNPANMIVLPLILGIGVDNGVHIVHDYLHEPAPYRMSASAGAAIVVNTLMNIVGFGCLMIATHRGLHSLGRVLTLGMACCMLSAIVMPSLLRLLPDMRGGHKEQDSEPPTSGQPRKEHPLAWANVPVTQPVAIRRRSGSAA